MAYLDDLSLKRSTQAQKQTEADNLGAMLVELKKMQMASLMGQSKPSVVLTDQTDLGDKIKELTANLTAAVKSTDTTSLNKDQLASLHILHTGLEQLTKAVNNTTTGNRSNNSDLIKAIQRIDLKPIVNLPAPMVNVEAKDIDFSPLQDTIREYFTPPETKLDLNNYRAQDIKDSGDMQYVGFVNPKGNWYIIENDIKKNSMRYLFGSGDYTKHFKKASSYAYKLLNEAIDATT